MDTDTGFYILPGLYDTEERGKDAAGSYGNMVQLTDENGKVITMNRFLWE